MGRGSRTLRGRVMPAVPALLAAVVLLVGCGSARYEYVTNKDAGTFLKIPSAWQQHPMLGPAFVGIDARNVSPEAARLLASREWVVGIDAAAKFDDKNLLLPDAPEPKGFVQVRQLLPEEAATLSTNDLRNLLVSIEDAEQEQAEQVRQDPEGARLSPHFLLLTDESVHKEGGVHGVHLVYQLRVDTGLVTIDQTSLFDQDQTMLYQLVFACSSWCYDQHGAQIHQVQTSFTIKPIT
ncbi:hypothetical protein FDG2_5253 [Candidatus Protofrankia californiensis]|uniref:Lipoprotein n=2 Tax=Protofrankia TaxID=2994361 RepID=A0A1C3PBV3_9ACTN|nr:hypothetical protein FDG2_5253 [Candidatus Protofrankia californiensis]